MPFGTGSAGGDVGPVEVTRTEQAGCGLVAIPDSQCSKLDPSTRDGGVAKMGLDATVPLSAPEFRFRHIGGRGEREVNPAIATNASAQDGWRGVLGG